MKQGSVNSIKRNRNVFTSIGKLIGIASAIFACVMVLWVVYSFFEVWIGNMVTTNPDYWDWNFFVKAVEILNR